MKQTVPIRKAVLHDVKAIHTLINNYARRRMLLPRSLSYIYDNIRDFTVGVNRRNQIIACCAVHVVWNDLAEVKSLVVKKSYQGKGIGSMLIRHCLNEAVALGVERIFALTYKPEFFKKHKFRRISKSRLPAQVWRECIECHLFPDCEEVALVKQLRS